MTNQLRIGQTVRNFGVIAKVDRFHEITGDPILRFLYNDGSYWVADAAKCEPIDEKPAEVYMHKDGLIAFGGWG